MLTALFTKVSRNFAAMNSETSPPSGDPLQVATRRWLLQVLDATGFTSTQLAMECGLAASTLNRFLNSPDVKHTLSARTIAKIAARTGIPAPSEMSARSDTDPEVLERALSAAREVTSGLGRHQARLEAQLTAEIYDALIAAELRGEPLDRAILIIKDFLNRRLRGARSN